MALLANRMHLGLDLRFLTRGRASLDTLFTFGAFLADPSRNQLRRDGIAITIEPKIMDVLCMLADCPGRVVARSDLIDSIWKVRFGGDESLTRAVSILRKTFRAADATDVYIETISKRGYRTVAQISKVVAPPTAETDDGEHSSITFDSYSIAVLAPECLACHDADAVYADIVGRDLTGLLARAPALRLLAYLAATDAEVSPESMASMGYIVSSTLARHGDHLQLRVGVTSQITGRHILSWRHERDAELFHDSLDLFLSDVSMSIVSEVQIAEAAMLHKQPDADAGGDKKIRSTEMLRLLYSPRCAAEIICQLEQLIKSEPDNAAAHASLAVQLAQNVVSAWTNTPRKTCQYARHHLSAAQRLAPTNTDVLMAAGVVESMIGDPRTAVRHLTRAASEDLNNPHALAMLGWQTCLLTSNEASVEMIRKAERLAPHHPRYANWAMYRGSCWLKLGDVKRALAGYRSAQDRNPNYFLPFLFRACLLALVGRDAEARATAARMQDIAPGYTLDNLATLNRAMPHIYGDWPTGGLLLEHLRRVWPDKRASSGAIG